jgi:hypothetical protein
LQRDQCCKEHPHPLPALVLGLHLPSIPDPLSYSTRVANLCFAPQLLHRCLDAAHCPDGPSEPLAPVPFDT